MSRNINLMPPAYRERLGTSRLRQRFTTYGLVAAVAIGALVIHSRAGVGRMKAQARDLTARVAELEAVRAESLELNRKADALARNLSDYYRLALPINVTEVLGLLSQNMPEGLYVTELIMGVGQRAESMSAMEELRQRVNRSKSRKTEDRRQVRYLSVDITGVGQDGVKVAEFVGRLESQPAFGRVQLDYDRTKSIDESAVREFRVRFEVDLECRYLTSAVGVEGAAGDE